MRISSSGIARYLLASILVISILGVFQLTRFNKEKTTRIEHDIVQTQELRKTQKRLIKVSNQLDEALYELQQAKIKTCTDQNKAIKAEIVTEFRKDVNQMNQLLPPPRSAEGNKIVSIFVASGVKAVKEANPYHDCSNKALGIIPLPKPILSSGPKSKSAFSSPSSIPKDPRAGTALQPMFP